MAEFGGAFEGDLTAAALDDQGEAEATSTTTSEYAVSTEAPGATAVASSAVLSSEYDEAPQRPPRRAQTGSHPVR